MRSMTEGWIVLGTTVTLPIIAWGFHRFVTPLVLGVDFASRDTSLRDNGPASCDPSGDGGGYSLFK